ncbi:hypothetical protein VIN01S_07030 [Vibrio inusitatus NBRC 102082]|uniref:DUF2264 domain-containing protein n=1 Tax=Vibrio inusitatus NBRC 102082 TaxID=1219070 RepID=A0A4Y3HRY7_9VIBR|nr:DUF2264 domain-containing protein [Vibrio inusitatus]GEA49899.1 hypothetical protein VIN01S_07030 [Vibrio inusitatus NBRC 102082]
MQNPFSNNPLESRADYQRLVNDMYEPLVPYYEKQGASIDFGDGSALFDMKASSLEGVARPLWGVIPLVVGGGEFKYWPLVREMITQGVDSESPHYWGATSDIDQRSVEMAVFGLLLALIPSEGWEPLDAETKEKFAVWLASIQQCMMAQNNWLFFTLLVQAGLRNVGRDDLVDDALEQTYLDRLASFYRGDGWYSDGGWGAIDHYGGFAMHFYSLIYATLLKNVDGQYADLFRERSNSFLEPFAYWFAENGECIAVGRSLIYRFATASFWGMAAVAGLDELPMSKIKGLWARQIRCWKDKPIFSSNGLLTRGYDYPNVAVAEAYNSPTSPYWAMKAFIPLLLPETHEFWQADAAPLNLNKRIYPMPAADSIVQRVGGHSVLHYGAHIITQWQPDKYNKFAYSTNFGMDVNSLQYSHSLSFGDNILAFSFDQGTNWQMRLSNEGCTVSDDGLEILWNSGSVDVTTNIIILNGGRFVRRHKFTLEQSAWVVESGFAIDTWRVEHQVLNQTNGSESVIDILGSNGRSIIRSLDGYQKSAQVINRIHTNIQSPRTQVPYLLSKLDAGEYELISEFEVNPKE